jgi:hypothetical protein
MKRKLYILLTFFSLCFFQSCQDHEIKKAPEAAELISKIAAADDQKLLQGLGLLQEKASKNGRISQTKIASLQLDSAIKRLNPDLGSTNYSFSIEENKPYSLTNLVITENKGSYLAFFVEYISDNPKQGWNLANFSGKMKVTSVDGKREFERVVKPPQVKNGRTSSECEFNFAIVYVITPYGITQYTEWSFVCTLGGSGGFGWAVEGFGVGDGNNNGGSGNSGGEIDPGKIGIDDPNSPKPEFVVGNPDPFAIPIPDIKLHMKCFDPTKPAKFTIFVDQPVNNGSQYISVNGVGHSFFSIEQNGIIRTVGFYPEGTASPLAPSDPSQLKDNAGKPWDVSVSFGVSAGELNGLLNYINNQTPAIYHLNNFNCTNWVVSATAVMYVNLPANAVPWQIGGGLSPGQFGQDIRNFTLPDRPVTTSSPGQTGNAPANVGSCL